MSTVTLRGEAQEVALAEAQAVRAMAVDPGYRDRLAGLVAAVADGEVDATDSATLEELLELGLQSGRIRALYGPGGETAALGLYRRLPRGAELVESSAGVTEAMRALVGRELSSIELRAVGPGAFTLSLAAGELEVSVRLDRQGSRLTSVGI
ncbi:MAG TPA: hypothetical protein VFB35_03285 [Gaiellaceae bacterium]|nr:hypothetical protein [Gaiellaceae bacterium]